MVSNKEAKLIALDLIETFGLPKNAVAETDLKILFENKEFGVLISSITKLIDLQVKEMKVIMEYDLSRFGPPCSTGVIFGNIEMPNPAPRYGTNAYNQYPWKIRLLNILKDDFDEFICVAVHEMAHIILRSRDHKRKDSEEATDMMIIMLGFEAMYHRAHMKRLLKYQNLGYLSRENIQSFHSTVQCFKKKGVTGPEQAYKSLNKKKSDDSQEKFKSFGESLNNLIEELFGKSPFKF